LKLDTAKYVLMYIVVHTLQNFWLLGTGDGKFDETDKSQLNTINPVSRDTATVPPYGWVAFRFLVCVLSPDSIFASLSTALLPFQVHNPKALRSTSFYRLD
jgi:Multicopper oxidase